jgi:glycoside/pentoside/hexuronide:cation symporter, GPH family
MKKLPLRLKLLFSTGDLSTSIPLAILMFFQLYFMTDVAGLRPDLAGWAVGIGKIWDAVNDPLIGLISDRIRSRFGRRRVMLLACAAPLGLSFLLMWLVPPFGKVGLAVYYCATFIIFDTFFTIIHVSYNSLTPELTSDYDERSTLNGYRMAFSIIGTLGTIILATVMGWFISDKRVLFAFMGIGLGLVSIIPPLVVFRVTKAYDPPQERAPMSMKQAITETLSNRPFWMVMGLYLLSWTTASIMSAVLIYFANYYLHVPEQANYLILLAEGSAILFIPFWVWVARKLDKRRAYMIGTLSWVVVLLTISAIRPDQLVLAYILAALSGSGIATAYVLPWSMIPDIIEIDQARTGERREGSYYSFASFAQKMATGASVWGMGQALAFAKYITPTAGAALPVQPPAALIAIRIFMGPVPAALLLVSLLFAWRYNVTRESHQALVEELQGRS